MSRHVSIVVKGKVQGVYFRQSTKEIAHQLGLSGTVNNNADGSVSITAGGEDERIEQLIAWCRKGPSRAIVSGVEVKDISPVIAKGFSIR